MDKLRNTLTLESHSSPEIRSVSAKDISEPLEYYSRHLTLAIDFSCVQELKTLIERSVRKPEEDSILLENLFPESECIASEKDCTTSPEASFTDLPLEDHEQDLYPVVLEFLQDGVALLAHFSRSIGGAAPCQIHINNLQDWNQCVIETITKETLSLEELLEAVRFIVGDSNSKEILCQSLMQKGSVSPEVSIQLSSDCNDIRTKDQLCLSAIKGNPQKYACQLSDINTQEIKVEAYTTILWHLYQCNPYTFEVSQKNYLKDLIEEKDQTLIHKVLLFIFALEFATTEAERPEFLDLIRRAFIKIQEHQKEQIISLIINNKALDTEFRTAILEQHVPDPNIRSSLIDSLDQEGGWRRSAHTKSARK